jgi:hypothetical protein
VGFVKEEGGEMFNLLNKKRSVEPRDTVGRRRKQFDKELRMLE